jgi:hypothetical protein
MDGEGVGGVSVVVVRHFHPILVLQDRDDDGR